MGPALVAGAVGATICERLSDSTRLTLTALWPPLVGSVYDGATVAAQLDKDPSVAADARTAPPP